MKRGRDLWIVIGVSLLIRGLFLAAYPFLVEGDGMTYLNGLLIPHRSHLLHPPGYPFFFFFVPWLARVTHQPVTAWLRVIQMFLPLAPICLLHVGIRRYLGRAVAVILSLLLSLDFLQLAAASSSRPEFLQSSLLILLLGVLLQAFGNPNEKRKWALYALAGLIFGFSYLVKFNSLAVFPLLLLPLWDLGLPRRFLACGASFGVALLTVLTFVQFFHLPSTGTRDLNLEHGVIYLKKLYASKTPILPDNGPATKKFLYAYAKLPQESYGDRDCFARVDLPPTKRQEHYLSEVLPIVSSGDAQKVENAYREVGSPVFSVAIIKNIFPLYAWLGPARTETLISQLRGESLKANLSPFAKNVLETLFDTLVNYPLRYEPNHPVFEKTSFFFPRLYVNRESPIVIRADDPAFPNSRWADMSPIQKRWDSMQVYGVHKVDRYSALFLSLFAWPQLIPGVFVWLVIGCSVYLEISDPMVSTLWPFLTLTLVSLFTFFLGTAALFLFRSKELLFAQPMISLLFILGLYRIFLGVKKDALKEN